MIGLERKSGRRARRDLKLVNEAEKIYKQFIAGEKLDTEKLMILQRSGLLSKR